MKSLVLTLPKLWKQADFDVDLAWVDSHVAKCNVSKVKSVSALKLSLTIERTIVRMVSIALNDMNILDNWESGRKMMEGHQLTDDGGIDFFLPYNGRRATFDLKVVRSAVLDKKWLEFKCPDVDNIESRFVMIACLHNSELTVYEPIRRSWLNNSSTSGVVFCRPPRVEMQKVTVRFV